MNQAKKERSFKEETYFNQSRNEEIQNVKKHMDYRKRFPFSFFDIEMSNRTNEVCDDVRERLIEVFSLSNYIKKRDFYSHNELDYPTAFLDFICKAVEHMLTNKESCLKKYSCIGECIIDVFPLLDTDESFDIFIKVSTLAQIENTSYHFNKIFRYAEFNNSIPHLRINFLKTLELLLASESQVVTENDNIVKLTKENSASSKRAEESLNLISRELQNRAMYSFEQNRNNFDEDTIKEIAIEFLNKYPLKKFIEHLNKDVYLQDDAKRAIFSVVNTHMLRLAYPELNINKNNALLIGPTGCGKTELIRSLKKIFPFPIYEIDIANTTPTGWKGVSVGDVLSNQMKLIKEKKLAECSLVFLDEADKMFDTSSYHRDILYTKNHQSSLLTMLESGNIIDSEGYLVGSCENMSFILAGAFPDLLEDKDIHIFGDVDNTENIQSVRKALFEHGVENELLGRIKNIALLEKLTEKEFEHIIRKYDSSPLIDIKKRAALQGISLDIENDAIKFLAEYGEKSKLGVRGLGGLLERSSIDMYSKNTFVITKELLEEHV